MMSSVVEISVCTSMQESDSDIQEFFVLKCISDASNVHAFATSTSAYVVYLCCLIGHFSLSTRDSCYQSRHSRSNPLIHPSINAPKNRRMPLLSRGHFD